MTTACSKTRVYFLLLMSPDIVQKVNIAQCNTVYLQVIYAGFCLHSRELQLMTIIDRPSRFVMLKINEILYIGSGLVTTVVVTSYCNFYPPYSYAT